MCKSSCCLNASLLLANVTENLGSACTLPPFMLQNMIVGCGLICAASLLPVLLSGNGFKGKVTGN